MASRFGRQKSRPSKGSGRKVELTTIKNGNWNQGSLSDSTARSHLSSLGEGTNINQTRPLRCGGFTGAARTFDEVIAKDHDHDPGHRDNDRGRYNRDDDRGERGHVSGAPGPIAGAGLPILAVGYGVYWLLRRRRQSQ